MKSGTLRQGTGTVSAATKDVDEYGTTYYWRIPATDAGCSGKIVERIFRLTTRLENYPYF